MSWCLSVKPRWESRLPEEMPDHGRVELPEGLGVVAVRAELLRADRGVVARVEEQDHALAAVLGEAKWAVGALELEVRRGGADVSVLGHARRIRGTAQVEALR